MREGRMQVAIEALEGRQFLSATVAAVSGGAETATTSLVVKPAILHPSAVEGHYTGGGTVVYNGKSISVPLTLTITATSETLVGSTTFGTLTVPLKPAGLKKLRAGGFSFSADYKTIKIRVSGTVTKAGKTISGKVTVTGKISLTGPFTLKKG